MRNWHSKAKLSSLVIVKFEIAESFLEYFDIRLGFEKRKNNTGYSSTYSGMDILDLLEKLTDEIIIDELFSLELFDQIGMKNYIRYNYSFKDRFYNENYIFEAKSYLKNDKFYLSKLEKHGIIDKIYTYYLQMKILYDFTKDNYFESFEEYSHLLKQKL